MTHSKDPYEKLKELLNSRHKWPGDYLFKFIVETKEVHLVRSLFVNERISERASANGRYISVSVTMLMNSSEEVIEIYKKTEKIPGLIAL